MWSLLIVLLYEIGFHLIDRPHHFHIPIASSYATRREATYPKRLPLPSCKQKSSPCKRQLVVEELGLSAYVGDYWRVGGLEWSLRIQQLRMLRTIPRSTSSFNALYSLFIALYCSLHSIHCSLFYVCASVIGHCFPQCYRKVCWQQAALLGSKPNCNTNTNSYNLQ